MSYTEKGPSRAAVRAAPEPPAEWLTQKARDALAFISSSHLGPGDDISATVFLPQFWLLHPPFPGDAWEASAMSPWGIRQLDHVQRGHELTLLSVPSEA